MSAELEIEATARKRMVDGHIRPADVTRHDVIAAFLATPRELYLPRGRRAQAYLGDHVPLGSRRVDLDPRVLAKMIEALAPDEKDLALVVGSGGGYPAAVMARLFAAVVALEVDEELAAIATSARDDATDNVVWERGPLEAGAPKHAPYNAILVAGAIGRTAEAAWDAQLAEGGRMVLLRARGAAGVCELRVKSGGVVGARPLFDAVAPVMPGFEQAAEFKF